MSLNHIYVLFSLQFDKLNYLLPNSLHQERLQVTTRVYFKGGDFADVRDLEGLYHDLNTTNWRDKLHHGESLVVNMIIWTLCLLTVTILSYHLKFGSALNNTQKFMPNSK